MNVKVDDLMIRTVMTTTAHQTCGHVKKLLSEHRGNCVPVVDPDGEPVGVVSSRISSKTIRMQHRSAAL